MEKFNIAEKLHLINDFWNLRIAGELNGQQIRLVKFKGDFTFHKYDNEDEMFLVIKGQISIDFQNRIIPYNKCALLLMQGAHNVYISLPAAGFANLSSFAYFRVNC